MGQGWGTNLVVAISNFVGVSPERLLIKLKGETFVNKDSALLVETASSTRRRLGGRNTILNGNNLPPLKAIIPNEKKIMIKENAILRKKGIISVEDEKKAIIEIN